MARLLGTYESDVAYIVSASVEPFFDVAAKVFSFFVDASFFGSASVYSFLAYVVAVLTVDILAHVSFLGGHSQAFFAFVNFGGFGFFSLAAFS